MTAIQSSGGAGETVPPRSCTAETDGPRDNEPGNEPGDAEASNSRPVGRDSWLAGRWWGLVAFATGCLLGAGAIYDNSFLTHLATGRRILDVGAPRVDPYSFIATGRPWVVQSWFASWSYAVLERVGGFGAIRFAVAVATGALLATIWRLTAPAGELVPRVVLCGLATVAGLHSWSERPQLMAFLLAGAALLCLLEERPAWWFAPIGLVWVNAHGSFPILFALVGAWWLVASVEGGRARSREMVAAGWATVGVVGGAMLSPYGLGLLRFPFEMLGRREVLRYIVEWRSPMLDKPYTWAAIALGVVCVAALVRRRMWIRVAVVAIAGIAAAISARNVTFASMLAVTLGAPGMAGLGTIRPATGPRRIPLLRAAGLVVTVVALVIAVTPDFDASPYPVESLAWADRAGLLDAPGARLIAADYVGNYLELFGPHPSAGVFVDDRAEVFTGPEITDYVSLLSAKGDWGSILDRYGATVVVWDVTAPLAAKLDEEGSGWRVVHRDATAVVAVRA